MPRPLDRATCTCGLPIVYNEALNADGDYRWRHRDWGTWLAGHKAAPKRWWNRWDVGTMRWLIASRERDILNG